MENKTPKELTKILRYACFQFLPLILFQQYDPSVNCNLVLCLWFVNKQSLNVCYKCLFCFWSLKYAIRSRPSIIFSIYFFLWGLKCPIANRLSLINAIFFWLKSYLSLAEGYCSYCFDGNQDEVTLFAWF